MKWLSLFAPLYGTNAYATCHMLHATCHMPYTICHMHLFLMRFRQCQCLVSTASILMCVYFWFFLFWTCLTYLVIRLNFEEFILFFTFRLAICIRIASSPQSPSDPLLISITACRYVSPLSNFSITYCSHTTDVFVAKRSVRSSYITAMCCHCFCVYKLSYIT